MYHIIFQNREFDFSPRQYNCHPITTTISYNDEEISKNSFDQWEISLRFRSHFIINSEFTNPILVEKIFKPHKINHEKPNILFTLQSTKVCNLSAKILSNIHPMLDPAEITRDMIQGKEPTGDYFIDTQKLISPEKISYIHDKGYGTFSRLSLNKTLDSLDDSIIKDLAKFKKAMGENATFVSCIKNFQYDNDPTHNFILLNDVDIGGLDWETGEYHPMGGHGLKFAD